VQIDKLVLILRAKRPRRDLDREIVWQHDKVWQHENSAPAASKFNQDHGFKDL
jgi:hypothetical protein